MDDEKKEETKDEVLLALDEMIRSYQNLPRQAMMQPVTHWDHEALLLLIRRVLRGD